MAALWRDLSGVGLSDDLSVPHDGRVGGELVHVVGSLRGPNDVRVVADDGRLGHAERGAGLSELREHRLEEGPDGVRSLERSLRREEDGTWGVFGQDPCEVARAETLQ